MPTAPFRLGRAALIASLLAATPFGAAAQEKGISGDVVKIGVLGDMSSLYEAVSGAGSVEAVKMAVEDAGGTVLGKKIEIVTADHQNKPDLATTIARRWYDNENVDVITDIVGSASSLAVIAAGAERKKIVLATNGATSEISGAKCTPYVVQYRSDTYAEAKSTAKSIMNSGGDTWFIIAADYALGHSLQRDISEYVKANGGKVVGSIFHPINNTDFSSYILAAQSSGAKIVAIANAGGDTINTIKAANEFGLTVSGKQRLTGMLVFISDIHAVGLPTVKGLVLETDFYWDMDEQTREWSQRFFKRLNKMPTMTHAANYSAVTNYIKAIAATGTDDADTVMAYLKKMKINDFYARNAYVREDGLLIHDLFMVQVKTPEESKRPWDYYKMLDTVKGDDAFRPLSESSCPLVKK